MTVRDNQASRGMANPLAAGTNRHELDAATGRRIQFRSPPPVSPRLTRHNSPELNPVERVWLHLKERFLSHRLHADYDAIADAASQAWNRLVAEAGRLTSLCSYPWIPKVKR